MTRCRHSFLVPATAAAAIVGLLRLVLGVGAVAVAAIAVCCCCPGDDVHRQIFFFCCCITIFNQWLPLHAPTAPTTS